MLKSLIKLRFSIFLMILGVFTSGCELPRTGPTEQDIRNSGVSNGGELHIIEVTEAVALATKRQQVRGFSTVFTNAGTVSVDRIYPGDTLSITIWENVDNGLFATEGQRVTSLQAIRVDELGNIFVPYAGTVRATGRTPNDLREELTELFAPQTPDPQIEVRRRAGDGPTVTLLGGVVGQGIFPIDSSTKRLTGMLASAGGVSLDPTVVKITLRRGNQTGFIWMQDLLDNRNNDVALRSGDQILVEKDERYYISLGATSQRRVKFETRNPNIVEVVAANGGLRSSASNPRGIFIFRIESAELVNKLLGRTDLVGPQKVAYVVDLRKDSGFFIGQKFDVQSEDTIYITEAPYVAWKKIIGTVLGTLNTFTQLDNAIGSIEDITR